MSRNSLEGKGSIAIFNRQRTQPLDLRFLRKIVSHFLNEILRLEDFDLTIHLTASLEMARHNKAIMDHEGSTDVITLDYSDDSKMGNPVITGELYVCVDEAMIQARQFHATWQSELIRYIVHGVLHLQGFDDTRPTARRRMKREEAKRLAELSRDFHLSKVRRKTTVHA